VRALVVALALAVGACGGPAAPARPQTPIAMVLAAVDGGEIDLTSLRGRVVVLHVFTTWSLEATADVPQLSEAAARGETVAVVGLALDPEGYQVVAPWRRALDVTYLLAVADGDVRDGRSPLGPLQAVPATIILDARGVVVHRLDRPLADGELARLLDALSI
jgi:hypothetical protein